MAYVDGYVIPVPTANKDAYREKAGVLLDLYKQNGAIQAFECWGDEVPPGQLTSFPKAVDLQDDETVALGMVVWPSKEVRDVGMPKVMSAPEMQPDGNQIFDGKRIIFGAFEVIAQL